MQSRPLLGAAMNCSQLNPEITVWFWKHCVQDELRDHPDLLEISDYLIFYLCASVCVCSGTFLWSASSQKNDIFIINYKSLAFA